MSRTLFLMKMLEDEKEWDNQIERDQTEKNTIPASDSNEFR